MYFIALLLYIACPVTLVAGIIMLIFKNKRKVGIIIVVSSCIIWAACAFYLKDSSRGIVFPTGFVSYDDYLAARKENITDPEKWKELKKLQEFKTTLYIDPRSLEMLTDKKFRNQELQEKLDYLEALTKTVQGKACLDSAQCVGHKFLRNAEIACSKSIEQLATYGVEWTSDTTTPKFTRFNWKNSRLHIISYIGDSVKFQTFAGSWQYQTYQCDYDFLVDHVIDVKATTGRLSD
ncbi:hypothetical protein N5853_09450 [Bartonella sp. HY329]|uniref:hypothetical protein n=1 Tax=unclassified Bartonella TaxID=2645622 RepID=UPI0021C8FF80|nr:MULTISPECIES: hypothetical protein [unclassified Bartonella]UXM94332.1 hypothetical protein N5853_09450 [Bartonella sp. HY329]UXN08655.1 hypothetical protein N5852_09460 [Bartonella sp. HY328]